MDEDGLRYWVGEHQAGRANMTTEKNDLIDALILALTEARGVACRLFVREGGVRSTAGKGELVEVYSELPWLERLFLL